MKQTRSFVTQRREDILQTLRRAGRIGVGLLAEQMGVSPLTIRRDLDSLEKTGLIYRRYGEAVLADDAADRAASARHRAMSAIARAAAALVSDHELLFINTSETALMVIAHIAARDVTIVTNSSATHELSVPPSATVLVTGGEIRPPRGVLSGEFALANIRSVSATTCFVGCAGISTATGVTSCAQQEATVNSLMVERADHVVLLADASKIGAEAGFTYAALDRIDLLITDETASDADVRVLSASGVAEVRRVPIEPCPLSKTDRI
ncbi:transcriptional regulator, DeoR family [Coriobacterium glomerans PW2]|uniref:Transcriptional regulator, DeoR family n=1 Tax=Coriobacterium glomerans (strain ATCC 49209 / DSM 20642 / JCM 10262 / PW2) TaxID=700015 RepID=F2N7C2_CORGP|nr:DeoR/GlpR family DNA-binding transcription regulator [Coriobacterium glomerans]AEB06597.1 transcriptional regulator, DeoR family [Coriobacterium glomerans PW2]